MNTYLITGSGGMIGTAIIDALLKRHDVTVCAAGRDVVKLGRQFDKSVKCVSYDATKPVDFDFGVDVIIHAASPASPDLFVANPVETIMANVYGVQQILEYARLGPCVDRAKFILTTHIGDFKLDAASGRNTKTGTRAGGLARPNGVRPFPLTSRVDAPVTIQSDSSSAAHAERPDAIRPDGLGACPRHETLRDTKKHERENFSIRRYGDSEIDSRDCLIVGRNDSATQVKTPEEFSVLIKSEIWTGAEALFYMFRLYMPLSKFYTPCREVGILEAA